MGCSLWLVSLLLSVELTALADGGGTKGGGKAPAVTAKASSPPKAPYAMQPKHPGVLTVKRGTHRGTVALRKGAQVTPEGLDLLADVLKAKSGDKHSIDPGLADLLATVSDHFGGRTIDIIDGFRPPPGHSNHNLGKAIDFRVEGVPIEAVRDFCLTLDRAGVGFYEGGKFVHLDARRRARSWTDDTPKVRSAKTPPAATASKAGSQQTSPSRAQATKIPKVTGSK